MEDKMRKIIFIAVILMTACSDPSPLKSNTEVEINELFGTKFGLIDQVYIQSEDKNLTVMNPDEFLTYLADAEKIKGTESTTEIKITLNTSDGKKQYSKEQTSEELSFDRDQNVLCKDKLCYKLSGRFAELISTFGER
jgi:hypothetical protein